MVKVASLLISILSSTALAQQAPPKTVTLSQKDVAEIVLKQGPSSKQVTYKYEQTLSTYYTAVGFLDWQMELASGYQTDRTESITKYSNDSKAEDYITTVTVKKSLLTGTLLQLDLLRDSYKTDSLTTTFPNDIVMDSYKLSLEQSLWGNMLGVGDRAKVAAAEATYKSNISLRANELEDVVLATLKLYWTTYVSQENFRESLAARDRSSKLVSSVRRRAASSYANPGELSQVQADLEVREREVKTKSISYLNNLESLLRTLSLDPDTEVVFSVPKELPAVPKLPDVDMTKLRTIRSQEWKVKAAQETLAVAKSDGRPRLDAVARLYTTGVDETTDASYAELSSGSHPQTYVGLRLRYTFGSGAQDEEIRAKKAALAAQEVSLEDLRNTERDNASATQRKVAAQYAIAESALRERGFREKAMQELNRTYTQGRTTLKDLIDAMNKYVDSQIQVSQTLGDYEIALNEWAAARDELIPDPPDQKEGMP